MIFDEGGFVRTLWYGRSRIWQKARKCQHFGGFKRNHLRLRIGTGKTVDFFFKNIYNDVITKSLRLIEKKSP